jgi:hypothetical protein
LNRRAFFLGAGLTSLLFVPLLVTAQAPPAAQSPHGDLAGDCATCHTAEGWTPLREPLPFDHQGTGFPLVAAHAQAGCRDCHQSLVFSQVATACADCHRDAHRGEMGPQCDTCHTPESWTNRRESFRIHSRTRFPLLGAHAGLDCESCHRGPQPREFTGLSTECVGCHLPDYQATDNPDHVRLGFPQQCDDCHSPAARAWEGGTFGAGFAHPATFPLTGAHLRVSCSSCHADGRFAGTPRQCVACHQDDFDRTTNPNHRAAGFPTTCESCHSTEQWPGATVDHNLTRFPLTGAHVGVQCARCHVGGRFAGTPTECVSCHQDDYDRAVPNHRASGFPTTCQNCHGTSQWAGATFNHPFPLSGPHGGIACTSCHPNQGNFRVFQCTTSCHPRGEMDDEHDDDDARGYVYESGACLRCHPDGRE